MCFVCCLVLSSCDMLLCSMVLFVLLCWFAGLFACRFVGFLDMFTLHECTLAYAMRCFWKVKGHCSCLDSRSESCLESWNASLKFHCISFQESLAIWDLSLHGSSMHSEKEHGTKNRKEKTMTKTQHLPSWLSFWDTQRCKHLWVNTKRCALPKILRRWVGDLQTARWQVAVHRHGSCHARSQSDGASASEGSWDCSGQTKKSRRLSIRRQ